MQIGEHLYCGLCYHRNRNNDSVGKISSLINAFSHFDIVELSYISHVSYITTLSVLNSNRLRVSFQMDTDYISECRNWLNYKIPKWSQPPRELYVNADNDFQGVKVKELLRVLISVGFHIIIIHSSLLFA